MISLFLDVFSISFFKDLTFLAYRSFSSLVSVIPGYFVLCVAVINGDVLDFFLSPFNVCI